RTSIATLTIVLAGVALFSDEFADEQAAVERVSVDEARGRARMLHGVYENSLHTMHRWYFDEDEKHIIPARALLEVFKESDAGSGRTTRWLAINTEAMNIDHEAKTEFDKKAVEALSAGKEEYEAVEDGVYRRAGAITLRAGCMKCHVSALTKQIKNERVAAIVVSMPVE